MSSVLIHVQHLMGIGHQRRMAAITRALCSRGISVTYVSGGFPIPSLDTGDAERVQLPPTRVQDARYHELLDADGAVVDERWRQQRCRELLQVYERCQPSLVLVESFPFARRMFSFELVPLLRQARSAPRPPVVLCSIRDILEPKHKPGRNAEVVSRVNQWFDGVLVHSDPAVIQLSDSFALASDLEPRVHYTGYVMETPPESTDGAEETGEVLVSAGGGVVGETLLNVAIQARRLLPREHASWRCLVGPNLSDAVFDRFVSEAPPGLSVERNRADFPALLARAGLSVSQAGYNTVFEALAVGCRALLVPYVEAGETEQTRRAELLAARSLASVLSPQTLSPQRLASGVAAALQQPPPAVDGIDFNGVDKSADRIEGLLAEHDAHG